jgi:hypothetical protein
MATPKSGPTKPIILDPEGVEALARIGCTNVEIGAFFKCSTDTLVRNYAESLQRGRDASKASVRRIMWKHAELGNSTALKYLVTNVLKERIEDPFNLMGLQETDVANQLAGSTPTETLLRLVKDYDKNKVG